MITLNLLPPEKKQDIRFSELYLMIKNFIITVLLLIILVAIILLLTKMALQNHFTKIVEETNLTTRVGKLFNQDIKTFNQILSNITSIQSEYTYWTKFIADLAQLTPDEINFSNLILIHANEGDKMVITGFAKTRTQLLEFKNNLENSPLFSEVVMPLENLLKKDNIRFDIKANINLKYLEKNNNEN